MTKEKIIEMLEYAETMADKYYKNMTAKPITRLSRWMS